MGTYYGSGNSIRVFADGSTVTTGASSASVAIPNMANGSRAKLVSVCCTSAAHINFTNGAGTATANSYLITTTPVIFDVMQFSHMNHIQEGSAAKVTVTPLET